MGAALLTAESSNLLIGEVEQESCLTINPALFAAALKPFAYTGVKLSLLSFFTFCCCKLI